MSLFINNILSRHLNQQANVQPRLPGKFEPVNLSVTNTHESFAGETVAEAIPSTGISGQSVQTGNEYKATASGNGITAVPETVQQTNLNAAAPQHVFAAMHTNEWGNENNPQEKTNATIPIVQKIPVEKNEQSQTTSLPGDSQGQALVFPVSNQILQMEPLHDPALNTVSSIRVTPVTGLMNNPMDGSETATGYDELLNRNLTQLRQKIKKNQPGKISSNIYQTSGSEINNSIQPSMHIQPEMKAAAANAVLGEQVVNSVVKISIGRIDVRAVTSPNPVKVAKSQPQKLNLTLDDYLKKRNGNLK